MNESVIDDFTFDRWSKELVELQEKHPEISKSVVWYDAFKDFDGSSGAFLPYNDLWVIGMARSLLDNERRMNHE